MLKITRVAKIAVAFIIFALIAGAFLVSPSINSEENDITQEIITEPQETLIKIFKGDRLLELYVDGQLTDKFKIGLGSSPSGDKNKEGDRKTPIGKYYVCTRNDKSQFTLFLGISYPNTLDAKRGLENGLIDQSILDKVKYANEREVQPPWNTALGGEIGIHGGGNTTDWTWGCIALSDKDIKKLWKHAKLKTPVEIYE